MAFVETLQPVLAGRVYRLVGRGGLEDGGALTGKDEG